MQLNVVAACSAKSVLQHIGRDRSIGEDEAQHRRHVGRDHARALAEAVDRDLDVSDQRFPRRELRKSIRGQDRPRRLLESVGLHFVDEAAEKMGEPSRVERLADDAGRSDEDFMRFAADRLNGMRNCHVDGVAAFFAREGIGIAGIDDERPGFALLQVFAADKHGGGGRL